MDDNDNHLSHGHPPLTQFIDYTSQFATDRVFDTDDEAIEYLRLVGRRNHMQLIKYRTKKDGVTGIVLVRWLACQRAGHWESKAQDKDHMHTSKKCRCSFLIKIFLVENLVWKVKVLNGSHSHDVINDVHAHCFAGKLTHEQFQIVKEMTTAKCKPKQIVSHLNQDKSTTFKVTSSKHVYNARNKIKKEAREDRPLMLQFLHQIKILKYFERHRKIPGKDNVKDIFFAHPESIKLVRAFPYVLVMDSTYKTNKYKMPLFEIVGFTSTWKSFCVAFAFMSSETTDNYTWILNQLKELLSLYVGTTPTAFITDRELALLNALKEVFPESHSLLCRRHVEKNCQSQAMAMTHKSSIGVAFEYSCKKLLESPTEHDYLQQLSKIEEKWARFGLATYLKNTWLNKYKERIVSAWCDRITHFGQHTTNRAESSHSMLKKLLGSSNGGFDTALENIHTLLEVQVVEVKKTFAASKMNLPNPVRLPIFKQLHYRISHKAFRLLKDEHKRAQASEFDPTTCGCWLRSMYGLPCAHEIVEFIQTDQSIPLSSVHAFWRQLDVDTNIETVQGTLTNDETPDLDAVLQEFLSSYQFMTVEEKRMYMMPIHNMMHREQVILEEPPTAVTKGRPKKDSTARDFSLHERLEKSLAPSSRGRGRGHGRGSSRPSQGLPKGTSNASPSRSIGHGCASSTHPSGCASSSHSLCTTNPKLPLHVFPYEDGVPRCMLQFVRAYVNVQGDGNCGYRAVSMGLFDTEEEWSNIRRTLLEHLKSKQDFYKNLMDVDKEVSRLNHFIGFAPRECWMTTPEAGHLIATTYQVALVILCEVGNYWGSYTYLPLTTNHGVHPPNKVVYITLLHDHYMALTMEESSPMPSIYQEWFAYHDTTVEGWDKHYFDRINHYHRVHPRREIDLNDLPTNSPIILGDDSEV